MNFAIAHSFHLQKDGKRMKVRDRARQNTIQQVHDSLLDQEAFQDYYSQPEINDEEMKSQAGPRFSLPIIEGEDNRINKNTMQNGTEMQEDKISALLKQQVESEKQMSEIILHMKDSVVRLKEVRYQFADALERARGVEVLQAYNQSLRESMNNLTREIHAVEQQRETLHEKLELWRKHMIEKDNLLIFNHKREELTVQKLRFYIKQLKLLTRTKEISTKKLYDMCIDENMSLEEFWDHYLICLREYDNFFPRGAKQIKDYEIGKYYDRLAQVHEVILRESMRLLRSREISRFQRKEDIKIMAEKFIAKYNITDKEKAEAASSIHGAGSGENEDVHKDGTTENYDDVGLSELLDPRKGLLHNNTGSNNGFNQDGALHRARFQRIQNLMTGEWMDVDEDGEAIPANVVDMSVQTESHETSDWEDIGTDLDPEFKPMVYCGQIRRLLNIMANSIRIDDGQKDLYVRSLEDLQSKILAILYEHSKLFIEQKSEFQKALTKARALKQQHHELQELCVEHIEQVPIIIDDFGKQLLERIASTFDSQENMGLQHNEEVQLHSDATEDRHSHHRNGKQAHNVKGKRRKRGNKDGSDSYGGGSFWFDEWNDGGDKTIIVEPRPPTRRGSPVENASPSRGDVRDSLGASRQRRYSKISSISMSNTSEGELGNFNDHVTPPRSPRSDRSSNRVRRSTNSTGSITRAGTPRYDVDGRSSIDELFEREILGEEDVPKLSLPRLVNPGFKLSQESHNEKLSASGLVKKLRQMRTKYLENGMEKEEVKEMMRRKWQDIRRWIKDEQIRHLEETLILDEQNIPPGLQRLLRGPSDLPTRRSVPTQASRFFRPIGSARRSLDNNNNNSLTRSIDNSILGLPTERPRQKERIHTASSAGSSFVPLVLPVVNMENWLS